MLYFHDELVAPKNRTYVFSRITRPSDNLVAHDMLTSIPSRRARVFFLPSIIYPACYDAN